jgi:hypothetical protein
MADKAYLAEFRIRLLRAFVGGKDFRTKSRDRIPHRNSRRYSVAFDSYETNEFQRYFHCSSALFYLREKEGKKSMRSVGECAVAVNLGFTIEGIIISLEENHGTRLVVTLLN